MRINSDSPDRAALTELGSRLARSRLEWNISQERLAKEAGVSKATLERIESGRDVRLTSFLRVLRALGLIEALDRLVPVPLPNPVERASIEGRRRQRASSTPPEAAARPWTWNVPADEQG
jgi:putative transcriptional regulator